MESISRQALSQIKTSAYAGHVDSLESLDQKGKLKRIKKDLTYSCISRQYYAQFTGE
jgi:hypothetical protein